MREADFQNAILEYLRGHGLYASAEVYVPNGRVDVAWIPDSNFKNSGGGGAVPLCGIECKVKRPSSSHVRQMMKYEDDFNWFSLCYPPEIDVSNYDPSIAEARFFGGQSRRSRACNFDPDRGFYNHVGGLHAQGFNARMGRSRRAGEGIVFQVMHNHLAGKRGVLPQKSREVLCK